MPTLRDWVEEEAGGEHIEAVVIGLRYGYGPIDWEDPTRGKVLTWRKAGPILESYDFPGSLCDPIYAWTKSWVIAVSQYDGDETPFRIPRNPADCQPIMPGGG